MKAIYLTGFMGAGKTTVGELLAEKLNLPVLDSDQQIVKKLNMTIKEIFDLHGESFFRDAETDILKELPTEDVIITTGGGIVIKDENRALMKKNGQIILLHADVDIIYDRVHSDTNRPLASKKTKDELHALYHSRVAFYQDCSFTVGTSNKDIDEIVNEIIFRLK
ncbi:shikimate kinase [Metabacillus bambusae]|uniref:Shikimate kinase n=1 Tax=Metabacillus bambusae TaxID=2795218 RepID=A0ABS3N244_9BACI|nr:shikimate kinase [Metabacillus bambusae]MBO1512340.1 shikimate kinase [Metabacillus bambusae]